MERPRALSQERTAQIESMEWDDMRVNKSFTQFRNVSEEDGGLMKYCTPIIVIVPRRECTCGRERSV